jgi:hypothetical protein
MHWRIMYLIPVLVIWICTCFSRNSKSSSYFIWDCCHYVILVPEGTPSLSLLQIQLVFCWGWAKGLPKKGSLSLEASLWSQGRPRCIIHSHWAVVRSHRILPYLGPDHVRPSARLLSNQLCLLSSSSHKKTMILCCAAWVVARDKVDCSRVINVETLSCTQSPHTGLLRAVLG